MENKMVTVKFEDGKVVAAFDSNKDGEPSIKLSLCVSEALEEAFSREDAVLDAKVVSAKFEGSVLVLELDTDKDGEKLLKLELDLGEAFDEAGSAIFKKKVEEPAA